MELSESLPIVADGGPEQGIMSPVMATLWFHQESADLAGVRRLRCSLSRVLRRQGLSGRRFQWLMLGVTELTTNVVRHSYPPASRLQVRLCIDQQGWLLELQDDGAPFDPAESGSPRNRPDIATSGYGLWLIAHCMPGLAYQRVGQTNCYRIG